MNAGNASGYTEEQIAGMKDPSSIQGSLRQNKRFKRSIRDSGKFFTYPIKAGPNENIGDRLRIKCVEYVTPTIGGPDEDAIGITNVGNVIRGKDGKPTGLNAESAKNIKKSSDFAQNFGLTADKRTRENQNILYTVELPIPQDINDSTSVTWGEDTLNMFQLAGLAIGKQFIESPANLAASALDTFTGNVNIPGIDKQTQEAFKVAISGRAINALGANVNPRNIVSRATGQVLNSNLELLFQGVNLRSFPFSITFSPRSSEEGQRVKTIIRKFKQSMSAKAGAFDGGYAEGIMIKAPDVFLLEYIDGNTGKKHNFLNSFKTCALTSINVNYTNAGTYATYLDGTPVNIRMDMTFQELAPIYAEDYNERDEDGNLLRGVGY